MNRKEEWTGKASILGSSKLRGQCLIEYYDGKDTESEKAESMGGTMKTPLKVESVSGFLEHRTIFGSFRH